jgi:hypothetical protein
VYKREAKKTGKMIKKTPETKCFHEKHDNFVERGMIFKQDGREEFSLGWGLCRYDTTIETQRTERRDITNLRRKLLKIKTGLTLRNKLIWSRYH